MTGGGAARGGASNYPAGLDWVLALGVLPEGIHQGSRDAQGHIDKGRASD